MKMKERISLVCHQCGETFYKLPCQVTKNKGKFCSKKCMDDHKRNGSTLVCNFCGDKFYRRFGEQGDTISSFCSIECYKNSRIVNAKKTTYLKYGATHRHIVIAEKSLGRKLSADEIVHHIDEDRHNNSIENLAILPNQEYHAKVHFGEIGFDQYRLINIIGGINGI